MKRFNSLFKGVGAALLLFVSFSGYSQNVGINGTGAAPDASAGLDVNFTNKGVLIPRVALTGSLDNTTISSPTISLLIYNTATAGSTPNDVTPGYYYYTASGWTRLANGNPTVSGWGTTGNSSIGTGNFLGTTGTADLIFKTNNVERTRVNSLGQVGIGTSTFTTGKDAEKLVVNAGSYNTPISAVGSVNDYLQVIVQNKFTGNNASSDFVVASDIGDQYVDFGINSSGYTESKSNILNQPYTAYLYASCPEWFYIGHGVSGKGMVFFTNTGNTNTNNSADGIPRMEITSAGNVGIGNYANGSNSSDPTGYTIPFKLTVDGTIAPKANNSANIGDASYRWTNIYSVNTPNSSSDRRLKTNIASLSYGLKELLAMQPVSYNWKSSPNTDKKLGLIAQDVKPIVPEVVHGDETKENLSISYSDLVPVLINAIKEQQKQIEELKQKVSDLEKK